MSIEIHPPLRVDGVWNSILHISFRLQTTSVVDGSRHNFDRVFDLRSSMFRYVATENSLAIIITHDHVEITGIHRCMFRDLANNHRARLFRNPNETMIRRVEKLAINGKSLCHVSITREIVILSQSSSLSHNTRNGPKPPYPDTILDPSWQLWKTFIPQYLHFAAMNRIE